MRDRHSGRNGAAAGNLTTGRHSERSEASLLVFLFWHLAARLAWVLSFPFLLVSFL